MPFPRQTTKRLGALRHWTCEVCGKRWTDGWCMEGHHKLPASLGGSDDDANFQLLCLACHYKAHKLIADTQARSVAAVKARLERTGGRWKPVK